MKLLAKSDIAQKKAQVLRQESEEGMKLARRVDALRELSANEEKSLELFRTKTLERIQSEIQAESARRGALKNEVSQLAAERKELLVPLDAEWEKVRSTARSLEEGLEACRNEEERLKNLSNALSFEERRLQTQVSVVDSRDRRSQEAHLDVRQVLSEAKSVKDRAHKEYTQIGKYKEKVEKALIKREATLAAKEKSYIIKEDSLNQEKKLLAKEWVLLNDRKAQLERIIKSKKI